MGVKGSSIEDAEARLKQLTEDLKAELSDVRWLLPLLQPFLNFITCVSHSVSF